MTNPDKIIVLTGGGTAGHVMPNIALIEYLHRLGYSIHYIGAKGGLEKDLLQGMRSITYHEISSGKLRRYFSARNFTDPVRILRGLFQSGKIMRKLKPNIVFSKGGFVTVPVVISAWAHKVPVVLHESDYTPGLANKLSSPFSTRICVTFEHTLGHVKRNKGVLTGTPIRESLLKGDAQKGRELCGFSDDGKGVVMVMGGSQGALAVNNLVREALPGLLRDFNVIHLCGAGYIDNSLKDTPGYAQFEFADGSLADLYACADIVISRAGANAIFEFLTLNIPSLLIPLPRSASRGDQLLNAKEFDSLGYSRMLDQQTLTAKELVEDTQELFASRTKYIKQMKNSSTVNGTQNVLNVIQSCPDRRQAGGNHNGK